MVESLPASPSQLHADDLVPFLRIIDRARASEERIARHVEARRTLLQARTGLTGRPLSDALAIELVEEAAETSALIIAGTSLPFTVPPLGPLSSAILGASAGTLWVAIHEVELCYALSFAYQLTIPADKLRLVSYWLVHLSNYEELRSLALQLGVRLTVRKLVEKLLAIGLTRAVSVMMPRVAAGAVARAASPWYVRATGYVGVPVLAVLAWRNTLAVGKRAIEFFQEEVAIHRRKAGAGQPMPV